MQVLFYLLAVISVITALMVVFARNPVYSVLSLIATFFAIAGQYVLLNAQFLAAVHVIVYAGAIMVLFLFVIMLLNLNLNFEPHKPALVRGAGIVSGGLLGLTLIAALQSTGNLKAANAYNNDIGLMQNLGMTLYNQYLLPFEVSSLLFLAAMVGAMMLAKRENN